MGWVDAGLHYWENVTLSRPTEVKGEHVEEEGQKPNGPFAGLNYRVALELLHENTHVGTHTYTQIPGGSTKSENVNVEDGQVCVCVCAHDVFILQQGNKGIPLSTFSLLTHLNCVLTLVGFRY